MSDLRAPDLGASGGALSRDSPGRLIARPDPTAHGANRAGLRRLDLGTTRQSYLFVPRGYDQEHPAPFVMVLHGAGGNSRKAIGLFLSYARSTDAILFAPQSQAGTWDVIAGGFGPDVAFIDRALERIFERHAIDPARVAVSGFSDGASYALSLGITNGDLFKRIIALSPGFVAPGPPHGRPRIFVAHGKRDGVLPYESTQGYLVPRLESAGYRVTFLSHPEGHTPMPRLEDAQTWLTGMG